MRNRTFIIICIAATLLSATCAFAGQPIKQTAPSKRDTSGSDHPRTVVPQMEHVFAPVFEGVQIKHDFVVENHGTAPLVIKNVRPD